MQFFASREMSKKRHARNLTAEPKASLRANRADRTAGANKRSSLPRWLYIAVPVALAILTSANSIWNDFATDDQQQILNNTFIKKLANIPMAFITSVWAFANGDIMFSVDSYYRPIFNILLSIEWALFGSGPGGWHAMNVLVHAAVTGLVFVVTMELTERRALSALAAALFAVHPAHAESVAWISGVTDPLMSLFLLPSFYFYVRYRKGGRTLFIVLSLALYCIALMSKETALALPVVVAAYELLYRHERSTLRSIVSSVIVRPALFVVPTAVYFLMRYYALKSFLFVGGSRYPLSMGLKTIPLALVKYLRLMFIPQGYSYQHRTPLLSSIGDPLFLVPAAVLAVIAVLVVISGSRALKFGAIWFVATLLPALAAIPQFDQEYVVQERYLYVPSIGISLLSALGADWVARRNFGALRGKILAAAAVLIVAGVWSAAYLRQNHVWVDSISVFKNCVDVEPSSAEAHGSLSRGYFDIGHAREAQAEAEKSLELDDKYSAAYLNLSFYAHRAGKLDLAIDYLERGSSVIPMGPITRRGLATIYLNLAMLYVQRHNIDLAENTFLKSIEITPRAVGWYYAGQFYFDQNRLPEARAMFELARANVPDWYAQIDLKLGRVYEMQGEAALARSSYERFLKAAPPGDENRRDVEQRLQRL